MVRFDVYAKRRFTDDTTDVFSFPLSGIDDDEELKARRGFLRVSVDETRGIFLPVLDEVVRISLQQVKLSKSPVKAVLVVGGFTSFPTTFKKMWPRVLRSSLLPVAGGQGGKMPSQGAFRGILLSSSGLPSPFVLLGNFLNI